MKTLNITVAATLVLLIQGCASPKEWARANTSIDEYNKDAAYCNAQMWSIPNGNAFQMAMFEFNCMQAKGYVRVPSEKK